MEGHRLRVFPQSKYKAATYKLGDRQTRQFKEFMLIHSEHQDSQYRARTSRKGDIDGIWSEFGRWLLFERHFLLPALEINSGGFALGIVESLSPPSTSCFKVFAENGSPEYTH